MSLPGPPPPSTSPAPAQGLWAPQAQVLWAPPTLLLPAPTPALLLLLCDGATCFFFRLLTPGYLQLQSGLILLILQHDVPLLLC